MLSISKMVSGKSESGDHLRYRCRPTDAGAPAGGGGTQVSGGTCASRVTHADQGTHGCRSTHVSGGTHGSRDTHVSRGTHGSGGACASRGTHISGSGAIGPVVVWNSTRACNLKCRHCYASATAARDPGELTTAEARRLIDDLAEFCVPVLLFSGGEPLLRPDFYELAAYARERGLRPVVSTNGTFITRETAWQLKETGVGYVGVSIDGIRETNDTIRGFEGAFEAALEGIRHCVAVGQRVGLRFTITRDNYREIDTIFDLVEAEGVNRVCFYHLVYSGRGSRLVEQDLPPEEKRVVLDRIYDRTADLFERGLEKEILTVDNHADAPYIYLRLQREQPERAAQVWEWLKLSGGNRSGIAIGAVDWHGNVHPDQFTMNHDLGNVRERKFGEIWTDTGHPIMAGLKNRRPLLQGRCAACRWLEICNGNFRPRAEAVRGDFWAADPACYLTEAEIQPEKGEKGVRHLF